MFGFAEAMTQLNSSLHSYRNQRLNLSSTVTNLVNWLNPSSPPHPHLRVELVYSWHKIVKRKCYWLGALCDPPDVMNNKDRDLNEVVAPNASSEYECEWEKPALLTNTQIRKGKIMQLRLHRYSMRVKITVQDNKCSQAMLLSEKHSHSCAWIVGLLWSLTL